MKEIGGGELVGFHILIGILIGVFDGGFFFEFKSVIMNNVLKSNPLDTHGFLRSIIWHVSKYRLMSCRLLGIYLSCKLISY